MIRYENPHALRTNKHTGITESFEHFVFVISCVCVCVSELWL